MKHTDTLTKQETIVLALVARGWRNTQIAKELFVSPRTVESHLYRIFDKLGVSSRTQAVIYALRLGYVDVEELSGNADDSGNPNDYARA